ncbi:hypothetical protein ACFV2Q_27630 [Streptomyces sp. NPDC059650]|uniref:hypothetical protein n=1 Tax=Streptomyces sp. NPDC059650 TaxID=3346896 RepID=UPI0036756E0C
MSDHEAAIAAAKRQIPSAEQLFATWPGAVPPVPSAVYADIDVYETGGFEDPRLVLYTAVSVLPSLTVGWCLFGAARNVRPGHPALPHAAREALENITAVRALQLLAVDHRETDEAAIEALAVPGVTGSLAALASGAHYEHERHSQPIGCDVGTAVYAYHHGPVRMGTVTADVVLIGSPIWIAKTEATDNQHQ